MSLKDYVGKNNFFITVPELAYKVTSYNTAPHTFPKKNLMVRDLHDYGNFWNIRYADSFGRDVYVNIDKKWEIKTPGKLRQRILAARFAKEKKSIPNVSNIVINMVGCDPEIFVADKDGKVIPAFEFLPKKGTTVSYWDGFQAEYTTVPNGCLAYHVDSIQAGLKDIITRAKVYKKDAVLLAKPCVLIDPKTLAEAKDEHVQFGCMPSFNVYDLKGKIGDGRNTPVRSAGGHIHLGLSGSHDKKKLLEGIKAMDAILATACVSLFEGFDDKRRREFYGLVGEYRTPAHGVEYRVLSNAWLVHPMIAHLVFDLARKAFNIGYNGDLKLFDLTEKEVIDIVQKNDVKKARALLKRNKKLYEYIFMSTYPTNGNGVYDVFYNGMASVLKDPNDVEKNWKIGNSHGWTGHSEGVNCNWTKSSVAIFNGEKV